MIVSGLASYELPMKPETPQDVRERILDAALRLIETRPQEFTMVNS